MTITQFLQALHVEPDDLESPNLIVAVGDTTDKQDALITGAWYGRRPYAVIESLPANVERSLAGGHAFMRQLVDVTLAQSPTATNEKPAGRYPDFMALRARRTALRHRTSSR